HRYRFGLVDHLGQQSTPAGQRGTQRLVPDHQLVYRLRNPRRVQLAAQPYQKRVVELAAAAAAALDQPQHPLADRGRLLAGDHQPVSVPAATRGRYSVRRPAAMNSVCPGSWTSLVCHTPRGLIIAWPGVRWIVRYSPSRSCTTSELPVIWS